MSGRKSSELCGSVVGLRAAADSLQMRESSKPLVRTLSPLRAGRSDAHSLLSNDSAGAHARRGIARADLQVGSRAMRFAEDVHSLYENAGDAGL